MTSIPFRGRKASRNRQFRKATSGGFVALGIMATAFGVFAVGLLLYSVANDGIGVFDWDFLTSFPSRIPEEAGIKSALMGTLWVMGFTTLFAVPVGIGAAIYLEEFAGKNLFTKIIESNINNLAGVPSVVYGLLGLAFFVYWANLGPSIIAGSLTLALLILPIIIVAAREGLRAVPPSIREAAIALGATKWQSVRFQVLPVAMPSVLTGVILALARAIGETAPLIAIGAFTSVFFIPTSPTDAFTVIPIQVYSWITRPLPGYQEDAAAGMIVLLIVLLSMSSIAVALRHVFARRRMW
ncbi:MAG: phosphate ABC transporter permease PstA [Dehalococcoidia bacterium]|nr:phosphate ABC transporter permease PstA [Dehalococcoidia bacterium]